jgi:hypothetical protein
MHFHLPLSKGKLASFRKRFVADEFERASKKLNSRSVRIDVDFPPDPRDFVADFTAKTLVVEGVGHKSKRQFYRLVQLFVEKSVRLGCSRFNLYSDIMFAFPKSQRFLSLPHLPALMIDDPNMKDLGIGQLASLGISFRNSRLGLQRVTLAYQNHRQTLEIATIMKIVDTSKLPERTYLKSEGIASLFLV